MFIATFLTIEQNTFLDYGTGEHRKILPLSSIDMDRDKKFALVDIHALTGNEYVSSSFFRRRTVKEKVKMMMNKKQKLFPKIICF